ncbi:MAG: acyl-CoA dehydrogenase family protein [Hyphomicrobiaceae bacterium]
MDFDISAEQEQRIETARRIGRDFGLDYWRALDAEHRFPHEIWRALCAAGIAGAMLPEEHGGGGLGMLDTVLMLEALTEAGAGQPLAQLFMLNPVFGGRAIVRFGTDAMRRDVLPRLIDGSALISFALTEPGAGNNSLNIKTVARRDGKGWRLSGQKVWISGHDTATHLLVVVRTAPVEGRAKRTHGISMFLIDAHREGIHATPIIKAGTHPIASFTLFFDDVSVDPGELVGTLDDGWPELLELLNGERIITAAGLVGTGNLALRLGVEYAKERRVFGDRPIGSYQGVQFPLARAAASLNVAGLINRKAAWLMDHGRSFGSEANTAKLIAADAAFEACDRAMQAMGGMGYATEFHVERLWRDTRVFGIAPIPQEMILSFIATHDLGLPRSH